MVKTKATCTRCKKLREARDTYRAEVRRLTRRVAKLERDLLAYEGNSRPNEQQIDLGILQA